MKGLRIALAIVLSGIMVLLGAVLVRGISGESVLGDFRDVPYHGSCTLQAETEIDSRDIGEIIVDMKRTPFDVNFTETDSREIYILESEDEKIRIREYYNKELEEKERVSVSVNDGRLNIKSGYRSGFFGTITVNGYVEILLPKKQEGEWKLIQAQATSGDVIAGSLAGTQLKLSSTSGCVEAESLSCEDADLSATSGDIHIESLGSRQAEISTTSGDIRLGSLKSAQAAISSTSGGICVEEAQSDRISLSSTSGEVQAQMLECGEAVVSTTSGGIAIGEINGDLTVSSGSGDQRVGSIRGNLNMDGTSSELWAGSVTGELSMSSTSGDIRADALSGPGIFQTSSGEIIVSVKAWAGGIRAESTSGEVYLTLPDGIGSRVELGTVSGDISTCFDDQLDFNKKRNQASGTVSGEPLYDIRISTTSGDIGINSSAWERHFMSKRSCEAARSTVGAVLRMARLNCIGVTAQSGRFIRNSN